jgi:short subunit dehydrogenase-like uncharacterized protein
MADLLIYGATGYTGRLISSIALDRGLDFIVAGRTSNKLSPLALSLGVSSCTFDMKDPSIIDHHLEGVRVLLNCAGPFVKTAEPLVAACIRQGVHYLDIAAEFDSYLLAAKRDIEAKVAGVMLLPGCGGSVAMLGCLAGHAAQHILTPIAIDIALKVSGPISHGSASSATSFTRCIQRVDGSLVYQDQPFPSNQFNFKDGKGIRDCFPIPLPDLMTIWQTLKIPNIRTYVCVDAGSFSTEAEMVNLPDGPTPEQRELHPYHAAVTVTGQDGKVHQTVLHTVNGYTFTALAAVEAARRVIAGESRAGSQTPALIFGNGFVETIANSQVEDVATLYV